MSAEPRFELIIGPAGDYYYFKDEILERIQQGNHLEYDFICFLPVKRAVRYFKEQLVDAAPNKVLADPPIYTFYEFMVKFYREFPEARKIIAPAMRLFLVEAALKQGVDQFRFFSGTSAKRRGLVRKIDTLLVELREYGYSAEMLQKHIEQGDARTHDFSVCIEAFEQLLGQRLIDEAGAIQKVFDRLDDGGDTWQRRYPGVKMIYMNGYGLFSRPMLRFFECIRGVCSVKVKLDYLPEADYAQLFEHVKPAYEALEALNPHITQHQPPQEWERRLFNHHYEDNSREAPPLDKDVLIQPANSRQEEVAFIASYVKRLHLSQQIPLHKIALTFPTLEDYAPLIHEIFSRYEVPYNLSTGFQLSQSPLVRSFLLVLEVPMLGYEVKKLLQLLSSPFFRPTEQPPVDVSVVKALARELRITHFHGKWKDAFEKHLAYLQSRVDEADLEDEYEVRQIREQIEHYRETVPLLENLLDELHQLEQRHSVTKFREQFLKLLESCGFLDWYKQNNKELSPLEEEREYRAFNRFIKLLDQFSWIVTNLHGEQKLTLKEFQQYLGLLLSQATYNLREWSDYGVQIMPRLEVLSTLPEVLIFGGMIEGDFPRPFTRDVFFSDQEREALGLTATEDLLAQDRYLFYQILSTPVQKLIFTYPRFQKEAPRVPSNFLNVLADQLPVNWRSQVPSALFLQDQQSLLERVALRIPAGIRPADLAALRKWLELTVARPDRSDMLSFWLQRMHSGYAKRQRERFSEYEGMLQAYPEIVKRLQQRFGESVFSITRLETFAFCPIQFFFRYIAGLEEAEEVEPGLTALERGLMVHNTLFRFYQQLREQNALMRPWEHLELLREIAREELAALPFSGMLFELEQEKYLGNEYSPGLWETFLKAEAEAIGQLGFYPAYFEVAFGRAGRKSERDPASSPEPVLLERDGERLKLIGKVDRIDLNPAGQAILLDYKTGSAASHPREVLAGLSLQLPVYAMVLPQILARARPGQPPLDPVMTAIYQVKDEENCQRIPEIYDREAGLNFERHGTAALPNHRVLDESGAQVSFAEMLERVEGYLFDYVERIRSGQFRHTRYPEESACESYCEFRRICRKDVGKLIENREMEGQ